MFKSASWMAAISAASALKVKSSYRPPDGSVPWGGPAENPETVDPTHKINYFVPNFGVDEDIKSSLKNAKDSEDFHKHVYDGSPAAPIK